MNDFKSIKAEIINKDKDKYLHDLFEYVNKKISNKKWYIEKSIGACNSLHLERYY